MKYLRSVPLVALATLAACGSSNALDAAVALDSSIPEASAPIDSAMPVDDARADAAVADASPADVFVEPTDPLMAAETCAITAPTTSTLRLHLDGTRFRDVLGRHVILRGVNAGGRAKWSPFFPFAFTDETTFTSSLATYVAQLAGWGINVVRLPFSWEALEPTRGTIDEAYLAHYRAEIAAFAARGIHVVVDFHQDAYASPFAGDGFPLWTLDQDYGAPVHDGPANAWFNGYYDTTGPMPHAFDRLWRNDDHLLDAMEAMWRTMATRLGNDPGVIGFEIINEPGWGTMNPTTFERDVLTPVLARIGTTIRTVVPDAILWGGGTGNDSVIKRTGMTNPALPENAFVYAPHYYDQALMIGGPYRSATADRADVTMFANVGYGWNRPVFVGEYGADWASVDAGRFLADMGVTLDGLLASGTVWEASRSDDLWNHERLGLITADGTERPGTVGMVRAYPRAVDGTIERTSWDAATKRYEIVVGGAGSGVTEIELPVRVAGTTPAFTIDHGCVAWDAATSRLLVRASAPRWHLVAQSP